MVRDDRGAEFDALLRQLEDWYADDVRARDYSSGPGTLVAEHAVLRVNKYPGRDWRREWREAGEAAAQRVMDELKEELYGLDHGPSRSGPASGLHPGTREWRLAIANADGSLRAVARRFGISHTEVRRLRQACGS